jgi:menaquinone-9 beta-reductase
MIDPTLNWHDAESRVWDAVIVGAGPAGAIAAHALAKRGHDVLLLDKSKFPRPKVCGGCINRRAQHALADAGLAHLLEANGASEIGALHLASQGRAACVPLPKYRGISRATLDAALVRAAVSVGAQFIPQAHAQETQIRGGVREVTVRTDTGRLAVRGRIVIAASGLGGGFLSTAATIKTGSRIGAGTIVDGVPDFFGPHTIYMACAEGGYAGCTIVDGGLADIAAAFDASLVKETGGLANAAVSVFEAAGFPVWDGLRNAGWSGTPALTRQAACVSDDRMLLVGDAAGYVEPFTGEGIAWALTTGLAASEIAGGVLKGTAEDYQRDWQRRYNRIVTRRQYTCYATTHALRHPQLLNTAIRIMAMAPMLARPFVRTVNRKIPLHKSA